MGRDRSPSPARPASRERRAAVLAARRRPMAHRLQLALAWDELAVELRSGLRRARARKP